MPSARFKSELRGEVCGKGIRANVGIFRIHFYITIINVYCKQNIE